MFDLEGFRISRSNRRGGVGCMLGLNQVVRVTNEEGGQAMDRRHRQCDSGDGAILRVPEAVAC